MLYSAQYFRNLRCLFTCSDRNRTPSLDLGKLFSVLSQGIIWLFLSRTFHSEHLILVIDKTEKNVILSAAIAFMFLSSVISQQPPAIGMEAVSTSEKNVGMVEHLEKTANGKSDWHLRGILGQYDVDSVSEKQPAYLKPLSSKNSSINLVNNSIASSESTSDSISDFNGDGFEDIAIGTPFHHGAVHVIYGSASGLNSTSVLPDQLWEQGSKGLQGKSEAFDDFGASLSSGDYNGDGYDDLAIGAPGEEIDSAAVTFNEFDTSINSALDTSSAGIVQIIYGSPVGLNTTLILRSQFFIQGFSGVGDFPEYYDRFGSSLSSGDYNGDKIDDLSIGVPLEDTQNVEDTGIVHVIYGSPQGLGANTVLPDQLWTQELDGLEDIQAGDSFGYSLSSGDYNGDDISDLSIGVPFEDDGTVKDTGVVHVVYGSPRGLVETGLRFAQLWSQIIIGGIAETDDRFGSTLSTGDYNGDGFDDLSFGVDGEDNAGIIQVIYGTSLGLSGLNVYVWRQELPSSGGALSITSGDYNGDKFDDFSVGLPHSSVGTSLATGSVQVVYGSAHGLNANSALPIQLWTQDSIDILDFAETFDHFGHSLSSGDYNGDGIKDLAIGAPSEDIGGSRVYPALIDVGVVHTIYGSAGGLNASAVLPNQRWWEGSTNIDGVPERGEGFGWALSSPCSCGISAFF